MSHMNKGDVKSFIIHIMKLSGRAGQAFNLINLPFSFSEGGMSDSEFYCG